MTVKASLVVEHKLLQDLPFQHCGWILEVDANDDKQNMKHVYFQMVLCDSRPQMKSLYCICSCLTRVKTCEHSPARPRGRLYAPHQKDLQGDLLPPRGQRLHARMWILSTQNWNETNSPVATKTSLSGKASCPREITEARP